MSFLSAASRRIAATLAVLGVLAGCAATPDEVPSALATDLPGTSSPAPEPVDTGSPKPPPVAATSWTDAPSGTVPLPTDASVVGLSPDGSNLLLSAPDPNGLGCEEGPPYSLQLLNIETGALRPAVDPTLGLNVVNRRSDGTALLWAGCEGFIAFAYIADVEPSGAFVNLVEVPLPETGEGYVAVTAMAPIPGSENFVLVEFQSAGGSAVTTISPDGVVMESSEPVPGDSYRVVSTSVGVFGVLYGDGLPGEVTELRSGIGVPGYVEVVVARSGSPALVAGDAGIAELTDGAAAGVSLASWLDDPTGDDVAFGVPVPLAPDRAFVVRDVFGSGTLLFVGPDGIVEVIDENVAGYEGPWVSDAGTRLVYVRVHPDTFDPTVVIRDLL